MSQSLKILGFLALFKKPLQFKAYKNASELKPVPTHYFCSSPIKMCVTSYCYNCLLNMARDAQDFFPLKLIIG